MGVTPEHSPNELAMPACAGSGRAERKPHISITQARLRQAECFSAALLP